MFLQSNEKDPSTITAPNLTCLGESSDPAAPTAPTPLDLTVLDFQDSDPVKGATVEVYTSLDKVNAMTPDATSTPTDDMGKTSLTVPPGSYRVIFRTYGGVIVKVGQDPITTLDTYEFNRTYNDPNRLSVSQKTKNALPALVNVFADDTQGVVAGSLHDCDDKEVGGTLISLKSTGGAVDPANNFYFNADVDLPSREQLWASADGLFVGLNLPPGNVTLDVYGRMSANAGLTHLGSDVLPVRANAITIVQVELLTTK